MVTRQVSPQSRSRLQGFTLSGPLVFSLIYIGETYLIVHLHC